MKPSELFIKQTKGVGRTGLYNIAPIENISSIIKYGILSNEQAEKYEHVSIAMKEVQKKRDEIRIFDHYMLHQYANLYFDFRNPMLSAIRTRNNNICVLKIKPTILDVNGVVVSDKNAASKLAIYYPASVGLDKLNYELIYAKYWTNDDPGVYYLLKTIKCAEVLVPNVVPYSYIICAAVANKYASEQLQKTGFVKRIHILPEEFF